MKVKNSGQGFDEEQDSHIISKAAPHKILNELTEGGKE